MMVTTITTITTIIMITTSITAIISTTILTISIITIITIVTSMILRVGEVNFFVCPVQLLYVFFLFSVIFGITCPSRPGLKCDVGIYIYIYEV